MLARKRMFRLCLALALGLAFFGCVGVPRRRPPAEGRPVAARNRQGREAVSAPPTELPPDPVPVDPPPVTPTSVPEQPVRVTEDRRQVDEPAPPAPAAVPAQPTAMHKTVPAGEEDPASALRRIHEAAVRRYASIDSYIVRLTRREVLHGKKQPEEIMVFKFRKQPRSVYFKWIGPAGKDREAIWVENQHEGKLHTRLAAGDMPFAPAGKHIALAPDNMLVRNNSRHSITEAGVDTLINRFGQMIAAQEKGDTSHGRITYLGTQQRPEFTQPLEAVEWSVPPGHDPSLPKGGRRYCYIDGTVNLPALIITLDERGQEVEYYQYSRFQLDVHLDDADFDPTPWDNKR